MSLIELAIAFVIGHPAVTSAIIGPRTMEQLERQLPAADVDARRRDRSTASTRSSGPASPSTRPTPATASRCSRRPCGGARPGARPGCDRRDARTRGARLLAVSEPGAASCPSRPKQQPSARSGSRFRRSSSPSCAAASPRRAGPPRELVADRSQGVQLATIQALARYWATEHDWRACEARLNALPQFTTEIDGVDIHFIHVRSRARERVAADHDARLAGLGHRAARGRRPAHRPDRARRHAPRTRSTSCCRPCPATASPASRPSSAGSRPHRARLGGADAPPRLHRATSPRAATWAPPSPTRWAARHPRGCSASTSTCSPRRSAIKDQLPAESEQERAAHDALATFRTSGFGYFLEQSTRPQTIGYALLDSPVALAAWMLDHDTDSYYKISRAFVDGEPAGNLTRETGSSTTSRCTG